jgi:hypothetical protein
MAIEMAYLNGFSIIDFSLDVISSVVVFIVIMYLVLTRPCT